MWPDKLFDQILLELFPAYLDVLQLKSKIKVNKIQQICLRLMINDSKVSYEELYDFTNDLFPQQRC